MASKTPRKKNLSNQTLKQAQKHERHPFPVQQYAKIVLLSALSVLVIFVLIEFLQFFMESTRAIPPAEVSSFSAAKIKKLPADNFQMRIGELSLGRSINPNGRIEQNEIFFNNKDSSIFLSVELINPQKGALVSGKLYYLNNPADNNHTLVRDFSSYITDSNQDVLQFTFERSNLSWNNFGKYQVKIISSENSAEKVLYFYISR